MPTPLPAGRRMLRLTIAIEGIPVVDRMLQGIEERASNMMPVWPAVAAEFRRIAQAAFDTEGASTGHVWQQLAESTQRDRARKGFSPAHPILQRTQRLMRSLTIGDSGGFTRMTPTSIEMGSNVEYFKYHQSIKPRTKLPRRAPIELTMDDRHALVRPIRLYLTGRAPDAPQRSPIQ